MERTHEALNRVIGRSTVEHAKRLRLSTVSVNKWKEPANDFEDSGSLNPLDRIETIIETATLLGVPEEDAFAPIQYLLRRFPHAATCADPTTDDINDHLSKVMTSTAAVIQHTCVATSDKRITPLENKEISQNIQRAIHQMQELQKLVDKAAEK